jgi:hypothetical protein
MWRTPRYMVAHCSALASGAGIGKILYSDNEPTTDAPVQRCQRWTACSDCCRLTPATRSPQAACSRSAQNLCTRCSLLAYPNLSITSDLRRVVWMASSAFCSRVASFFAF